MYQTSNNKLHWGYYLLTAVWLTLTAVSAYYFVSKRLKPFDPNGLLANAKSEDVVKKLVSVHPLSGLAQKRVIHFTDPNCGCNKVPSEHKKDLDKVFEDQGFTIEIVEVSDSITSLIPATPSLVVLDKGELVYMGPYSAGYSCSSNNSFVEVAMNNYSQGFNPNLIVSNVSGCFCQT
ncbi:DUF6436 domain-containing protein [Psychrosphaera aestuarii]|uniref:DUF6436 domain-containing protein n=1 Tax=Psychrosphaera aestuarii TaxID=1266052 RepID=UPI001B335827|nr:DUF6436 domain-containing protein [Psychrosphaera aestuarii]